MKNLKKLYLIVLLLIGLLFLKNEVYGKIFSTDKEVSPNETVTVTLYTNRKIEHFMIELKSNDGLTFEGASAVRGYAHLKVVSGAEIAGFNGNLATYKFKVPDNSHGKKYNVKFSILEGADDDEQTRYESTAVIKVKSKPVDPAPTPAPNPTPNPPSSGNNNSGSSSSSGSSSNNSSNSNKNSNNNNSSTITREPEVKKNEPAKSSNNNLKSLTIEKGELSPKFNRTQTVYSIKFPNDFDYKTLEKIKVDASKEENLQKIEGTGEKQVVVGENEYNIKVTAEDGNVKVYTIKFIKPEITEAKDMRLKNLKVFVVKNDGSEEEVMIYDKFDADNFYYEIAFSSDIEKLNIKTELAEDLKDVIVDIKGNENLIIGENLVTITLTNTKTNEKTVYTLKVEKGEGILLEEIETEKIEDKSNNDQNKYIIILSSVFGVLLAILLVIIIVRNKKKKTKNVENVSDTLDFEMNTNENNIEENISEDDIVKKEDLERAKIFEEENENILLNSDHEETRNIVEEVENKPKRMKGKRFEE